jgi:hypothetical protein
MERVWPPDETHAPDANLKRYWVMDPFEMASGTVWVRYQVMPGTELTKPEYPVTFRMTIAEWRERHSEFGLNEDGTEENSDADGHAPNQ